MTKQKETKNIDKVKSILLYVFTIVLALGTWNPFAPVQLESDADGGSGVAQIFTVIFVGVLLVLKYYNKQQPVKANFRKYIIFFFFSLLFTTVFTSISVMSISNYVYFTKLALCIFLVYIIPSSFSTYLEVIYKSFFVFSVSSSIIALLAFSSVLGDVLINHGGRFFLFGENPNSSGGRMALAIFFCIYFIIDNPLQWGKTRYFLFIAIIPLLLLLMAGGSRGSIIIAFACILCYLFLRPKANIVNITFIGICLGIFLLIGSQLIIENNQDFTVIERLISMREGNDGGRDLLMDRSLDVYLSNSLLFGSGTIEYVRDMKTTFNEERVVHNLFVYLLPVSGMVGSLLFYLFFFGLLKRCIKYRKRDILPSILFLFMFLLAYKTGGILTYLLMWYIWASIISITTK